MGLYRLLSSGTRNSLERSLETTCLPWALKLLFPKPSEIVPVTIGFCMIGWAQPNQRSIWHGRFSIYFLAILDNTDSPNPTLPIIPQNKGVSLLHRGLEQPGKCGGWISGNSLSYSSKESHWNITSFLQSSKLESWGLRFKIDLVQKRLRLLRYNYTCIIMFDSYIVYQVIRLTLPFYNPNRHYYSKVNLIKEYMPVLVV